MFTKICKKSFYFLYKQKTGMNVEIWVQGTRRENVMKNCNVRWYVSKKLLYRNDFLTHYKNK